MLLIISRLLPDKIPRFDRAVCTDSRANAPSVHHLVSINLSRENGPFLGRRSHGSERLASTNNGLRHPHNWGPWRTRRWSLRPTGIRNRSDPRKPDSPEPPTSTRSHLLSKRRIRRRIFPGKPSEPITEQLPLGDSQLHSAYSVAPWKHDVTVRGWREPWSCHDDGWSSRDWWDF